MCSLHLNSSVEIMWMFRSRGSKRVCLIAEVSVKDLLRWWFTEEWWRIIEDHYAQRFLWAKRPNWLLLLSCTIWIVGKPLQGRPVEFMLCYNNCTILPAVSFGEITVIILQLWEISYLRDLLFGQTTNCLVTFVRLVLMRWKEDMVWHVKIKLGPNFVEYLATSGL